MAQRPGRSMVDVLPGCAFQSSLEDGLLFSFKDGLVGLDQPVGDLSGANLKTEGMQYFQQFRFTQLRLVVELQDQRFEAWAELAFKALRQGGQVGHTLRGRVELHFLEEDHFGPQDYFLDHDLFVALEDGIRRQQMAFNAQLFGASDTEAEFSLFAFIIPPPGLHRGSGIAGTGIVRIWGVGSDIGLALFTFEAVKLIFKVLVLYPLKKSWLNICTIKQSEQIACKKQDFQSLCLTFISQMTNFSL